MGGMKVKNWFGSLNFHRNSTRSMGGMKVKIQKQSVISKQNSTRSPRVT